MRPKCGLFLGTLLLFGGCGLPRAGILYALPNGAPGRIVFLDGAGKRGVVSATLSNGERCTGRYATIPGPRVTWDDQEVETISREDTQNGMAVLDCRNGHLLRCNLARDIVGTGSGSCTDNRGQRLIMYF